MRGVWVFAVAIFAVVLLALALGSKEQPESQGRLPAAQAKAAALRDGATNAFLDRYGYTRYRGIPLDEKLERVSFFNGSRVVLEVAVSPQGQVTNTIRYPPDYVRAGSRVLQRPPWLLILFCLVFALATLRLPLSSIRTLDVVALLAFAGEALLLNQRLFSLSVLLSTTALVYLVARCAWIGLRPAVVADPGPTLIERLFARRDEVGVSRALLATLAAALVAFLLVAIPDGRVGDVGYASISGATQLLHGNLPYGNLPNDVVHGDTYPLLAYAIFIPAAIFLPVNDGFSDMSGALYVSTAAALIAAAGMYSAGKWLAGGRRAGGLTAAIAWIAFPPVVLGASSGTNDLAVAACMAWVLALFRWGAASTALLAVASWMKVAPALVIPIWVARLRGDTSRGLAAIVAVTVAALAWLLILGGTHGVGDMIDGISFQAQRGSPLSVWYLIGARPLQLAAQAAVVSLALTSALLVWRDPRLAADPRRIAALGAAVVLGLLASSNYFSWAYLPWIYPFVAAALLMPARAQAPETAAASGH